MRTSVALTVIGLGFGCGRSWLASPDAPSDDAGLIDAVVPDDVGSDTSPDEWLHRLGGEGPSGNVLFDDDGNVIIVGSASITSLASHGPTRWGRSLWGASIQSSALRRDRLVVAGYYGGDLALDIDLGDGALEAPDRYRHRFFVAMYDTEGEILWSRAFGDVQLSGTISVDLDDAGNVYLGGNIRGIVDFGGGPIQSDDFEYAQLYLASFTPDGEHRWSKGFAYGFRYDTPTIVIANDALYFSGAFSAPTSFGGETLVTSIWDQPFVASFETDGRHRWSRSVDAPITMRSDHGRLLADDTATVTVPELAEDGFTPIDLATFVGVDADDNLYVRDGNEAIRSYQPDGTLRWERAFRGDGDVDAFAASIDMAGNLIVMGTFEGDVDVFAGDPEDGVVHGTGRFVASYSSTGAPRWVRRHGSPWRERVYDVASDAEGNVYVIGTFTGDLLHVDSTRSTRHESELFLASFAPDGSPRWSHAFGPAGRPYFRHELEVGEHGVTVAGVFQGALDFGGGPLEPSGIYLARFTTEGRHRWSQNVGGTYASAVSFAVDRLGITHVVRDGGVQRFDPDGDPLGSISLPVEGTIAIDQGDLILAVVTSSDSIDLGGGALPVPELDPSDITLYSPRGRLGLAIARLSPSGEHRWSRAFALPGEDGQVDVATVDGDVIVLARGRDRCSFDCRPVAHAQTSVLRLSEDGETRWSRSLAGVGGVAAGPGLAVDERGDVYVTGNYVGPLRIDRQVYPEPHLSDGFLAVFASNGALRYSRTFGGPFGHAEGQRIAPTSEGAYVVGTSSGVLNLGFAGRASRRSESTLDTFLARFSTD